MKTYSFLVLFLLSLCSYAQVRVMVDDPKKPKFSLNLEYLNLDVGLIDVEGSSIGLSVNSYYEFLPGIGARLDYSTGYMTFGALFNKQADKNRTLDLGGFFTFSSKVKTKNTKVVLKSIEDRGEVSYNGITGTNQQTVTITSTYTTLPALRQIENAARAGLYRKTGAFTMPGDNIGNMNSTGVYVGLLHRTFTNVFIDVPDYGYCYNSLGSDVYVDLIFAGYSADSIDGETLIPYEITNKSPIGFRIGHYGYQIEKKARTNKKFGMSRSWEAGYRPYYGFFITVGLGITLIK